MIDSLFRVIAGKKQNARIDAIIEDLAGCEFFDKKEKSVLKKTLEVSSAGNYPSWDGYYSLWYQEPIYVVPNSIAEIAVYAKSVKDFYRKEWVASKVLGVINDAKTSEELTSSIEQIISNKEARDTSDLSRFIPKSYSDYENLELVEGFKLGVTEIDEKTNGIQPGTLASIAAFTGGGKSTLINSAIFKNVMAGKKGVLFSIELAPELVWMMFQARYLYEIKNMEVVTTDLIQHRVTDEKKKLIDSYDADFKKDMHKNLLIVDESLLNKRIIQDPKALSALYAEFEEQLGGLDFICVDHIHQVELMFPDMGNIFIRTLTSAGKTFLNKKGVKPVTLMAVQVNREGFTRACKTDGVYRLSALADLNECASAGTTLHLKDGSCTYGKLIKEFKGNEEIKSVDYQTGKVIETKIVSAFKTGTCVKGDFWRQLYYDNSPKNMMFTPNHRILVNGNKVKLIDLPNEFYADYIDWVIPNQAEQILIGTLMGDSCINLSEGQHRSKESYNYTVRMLQGEDQVEYLRWKCKAIGDIFNAHKKQPGRRLYVSCSKSTRVLSKYKGLTNPEGKHFSEEVLKAIGPWTLLTWYLDDGCLVKDSLNSYHIVISCTNFLQAGAELIVNLLKERFGVDSFVRVSKECRSVKDSIQIVMHAEASRKFLSIISPLLSLECINYKLDHSRFPYKQQKIKSSYLGVLKMGLKVRQVEVVQKESRKTKYNFEVAHKDHNYVLPGGLVSANCERASSYVIFMHTTDDSKIVQETKISLAKNRLGEVLPDPAIVTFNPAVLTVGSTVENISASEDSFSDFMGDFDGDF